MNRLERLLDLVHVLQTARAPVSLDALRELFPDYADGSLDATRRKFERDKAELAGIGLVLRFVSEQLNPHVAEWEAAEQFPSHEVFRKLGELGLLGLNAEAHGSDNHAARSRG